MCRALTYPNLMAGLRMPAAARAGPPPPPGADVMVDIALLR